MDSLAEENRRSGRLGAPQSYRLTIAAAAGIDVIDAIQQADPSAWSIVQQAVNYVDLMGYDFHGPWDENNGAPYDVSDFIAPMATSPLDPFYNNTKFRQFAVSNAVDTYLALGFEPGQIVVGIPAYGYLEQVSQLGETNGLWQPITGTFAGEYNDQSSEYDYMCIRGNLCHGLNSIPSDTQFVEANSSPYGNYSHAPWGYSKSQNTFVTYDDNVSVKYKCCWIMDRQFGGSMIWDLSGDFPPSNSYSIVGAIYDAFTGGCN